MAGDRVRVLFLCTGNSARSQMAEALLRARAGPALDVSSAGTDPQGVNALTVEVLAERGIDASAATSDHVDRYLSEPWDYVITVCDRANESCPVFPGAARRLHWSFPDPAGATGTDGERRAAFRRVRDAIDRRLAEFTAALDG